MKNAQYYYVPISANDHVGILFSKSKDNQWLSFNLKFKVMPYNCQKSNEIHQNYRCILNVIRAYLVNDNNVMKPNRYRYQGYLQYWAQRWMVSTIWGNNALTLSLIRSWKKCIQASSSKSNRNFSWSCTTRNSWYKSKSTVVTYLQKQEGTHFKNPFFRIRSYVRNIGTRH